jgi:carbohydrate kinase (thermoresistant glucokinase family)
LQLKRFTSQELQHYLMRKAASPLRIIVMGVSGSGKSTLAEGLSKSLGLRMKDGDELHLPESVAKMSAGIALVDADRWPWLDRIAHYLAHDEQSPVGTAGAIVSCSALKLIYRDRIRQQAGPVVFLFLDGLPSLIKQRMLDRKGHYMQAGLLDSQFQTLERPSANETDVIVLNINQAVSDLLENAMDKLVAYQEDKLRHTS